jgi:hypothetical protein
MPRRRHSREATLATLKNLARRSGGKKLTKRDVVRHVPESCYRYYFGSLEAALKAAGLESKRDNRLASAPQFSNGQLFAALRDAHERLGHEPAESQYNANRDTGAPSSKPFRSRFGTWRKTLEEYRRWLATQGTMNTAAGNGEPTAVGEERHGRLAVARHAVPVQLSPVRQRETGHQTQLFGEPIDFRGLRHAPINEQGVVYLFGMVSRELGFSIEALQQGFPDCEGKYLHDPGRNLWAKARIEFEFRASNFEKHGHDPNQCDFIVCWEDDWPASPLPVIELRREILKLPST